MKLLSLTSIVLAAFALCACDDEKFDQDGSNSSKNEVSSINFKALYSTHHTMSQSEAEQQAIDAANILFNEEGSGLKSYRKRTIGEVSVIKNNSEVLKSAKETIIPDTLAYVINFADSAGYALICADDRVGCPILACVDSGVLNQDAIDGDPGLAILMDDAEDFVVDKIEEFEESKDSLLAVADNYLNENKDSFNLKASVTISGTTNIGAVSVGPLLTTCWEQDSPYNLQCPNCDDTKHNKAGCVAIATAQVMAYHAYPATIDGEAYSWKKFTLKKHAQILPYATRIQLAKLIRTIGNHVGMDYGCNSSSAKTSDAINWMKKLGYTTSESDYSWSKVKSALDKKYPIIISGKRTKKNFLWWSWYKDGHAWVIDGYKSTQINYVSRVINTSNGNITTTIKTEYKNNMLHNNWGWGGSNNGYFAEGCFNTKNAVDFDSDYLDNTTEHNYRYKKYIYIVHP